MAIDSDQLAEEEDELVEEEDVLIDERRRLIRRRRRQSRRAGFPWLRWITRGLVALLSLSGRR